MFFNAHGHPEEVCQLELTGARRASRGEGHSLLDFILLEIAAARTGVCKGKFIVKKGEYSWHMIMNISKKKFLH